MPDKVIVTNVGALKDKYGRAGWGGLKRAVTALVAADKRRGLTTRLVALDDPKTMRSVGGTAVTTVASCRQNKEAIDAVSVALEPDYLLILGAHDIVPHQDLLNPAYQAGDDDDKQAWGDVPYACDVPYSKDVQKFVGPTRVVSRLPDLTGARSPDLLVSLLETAASWRNRPRREPEPYFALSAWEWRKSTQLSVVNVFGGQPAVFLSPPAGPSFTRAELGALCHFVNCHGGESDPVFYGQRGNSYPEALTSRTASRRIAAGTVAAAECCYGAQLYPSESLGLDLPICLRYLSQGAYAYFGSTTIAYGPAEGNGAADILTQQFLAEVIGGASIGRAALAARQAYVSATAQMDPIDLKTLAQFCVYGDPSITPIASESPTEVPKGVDPAVVARIGRRERRTRLAVTGRVLEISKPTAGRAVPSARVPPAVRKVLSGLARSAGVNARRAFASYRVDARRRGREAKAAAGADRYLVLVATPSKTPPGPVVGKVAVVAKQLGSRIVGYRVYYAR